FDRHVRISAMLVEQIDGIDFESLEGRIGDLFDMLRSAIQAWRSLHPSRIELRIKIKAEFRCYHHLPTKGSECFAYKFFIRERTDTSAVSKNVTPRSTAARISAIISCLSAGGP